MLEVELLEPEVVCRLAIDFPIEDWKAKNPHLSQHDNPQSSALTLTYGDVLLCEYSPAEALLEQLAQAGNVRQAMNGFEHDRRRLRG